MKIIDVHTHLGISKTDKIGISDPKNFVDEMDKSGIRVAIIFPIDSKNSENSYFIQNNKILGAYSSFKNRLVPFGRLRITDKNVIKEMYRLKNEGVIGFKLHPWTDPFEFSMLKSLLESIHFDPIIIFHSSHTKGMNPLSWEEIIKEFPNVSFIIGHAGGDLLRESSYLANKYENVYVEFSTNSFNRVRRIILGAKDYEKVPIDKILYGSDFPYEFFEDNIKKVLKIVSEKQAKKIFWENAMKLLKRHGFQEDLLNQ